MEFKRKGGKLVISQAKLDEYLDKKLHDLGNFMSNIMTAIIILSIMVVIQIFKASDIYLYGLILLPLIARGFLYTKMESYLRRTFAELLTTE